jgi:hypothetical protein
MFARTDFPLQKLMLPESILETLVVAQTGSGHAEIRKLGDRDRQLRMKPVHYDFGSKYYASRWPHMIANFHPHWSRHGARR